MRYCKRLICFGLLTGYADQMSRIMPIIDYTEATLEGQEKDGLIERLVAPALAQITRQQVRDLYANIGSAKEQWPHEYRSHAHLARLVGVKPLRGCEGEK